MQIFKRGIVTALFAVALAVPAAAPLSVVAADKADEAGTDQDKVSFTSPITAYRQGVSAYRAGDAARAVKAFEYASDEGVLGAQLRLARMYSRGDLVTQNPAKAYEQYRRTVEGFANLDRDHAGAKYVAEAYVAVGRYLEKGIPSMGLKRDVARAAQLYRYAASYFRDPIAQFKLARLYLKGDGIERNVSVAAKWFHSAAKKNHAPSQALLAEILWQASPAEKRSIQALALLDLALENAEGAERPWIEELHGKIFGEAEDGDKKRAAIMMAEWRARFGNQAKGAVAAAAPNGNSQITNQASAMTFQPEAVSVILGQPAGAEDLSPDAIFGAATEIIMPDVAGSITNAGIEIGGQ